MTGKTDALIAETIGNGLRGLTLFRTSEGRWQAAVTYDRESWRVMFDADPVIAIQKVLDGAPSPPDDDDWKDLV